MLKTSTPMTAPGRKRVDRSVYSPKTNRRSGANTSFTGGLNPSSDDAESHKLVQLEPIGIRN